MPDQRILSAASPNQNDAPAIPDLYLEQFCLGELSDHQDIFVRVSEYTKSPEGMMRLQKIEASNKAILQAHPGRVMAAALTQRHQLLVAERNAPKTPSFVLLKTLTVLTVVLLLTPVLVFFALQQDDPHTQNTSALNTTATAPSTAADLTAQGAVAEVLRSKGSPHLLIHRQNKNSAQPEPLEDGATIHPGDLLQVSYLSSDAAHGVIFSVDGRGSVTLHFPEDFAKSTALSPVGKAVALPHAYKLDDAPDFERFFFITSANPIDTAALLKTADSLARSPERAATAPLSLPQGLTQWSARLLKIAR